MEQDYVGRPLGWSADSTLERRKVREGFGRKFPNNTIVRNLFFFFFHRKKSSAKPVKMGIPRQRLLTVIRAERGP